MFNEVINFNVVFQIMFSTTVTTRQIFSLIIKLMILYFGKIYNFFFDLNDDIYIYIYLSGKMSFQNVSKFYYDY